MGVESQLFMVLQLNALVDDDGLRDAMLRELSRLATDRGSTVEALPARREMSAREWIYRMDSLLDLLDSDVVVLIDEIDLANEDAAEYDESEIDQRRSLNRVLQQLRGLIQIRNDRGKFHLSFLAAGVAASIFTRAVRFDRDNQLFGFASARPLKPMNRDEMREMVRKLGKRSGLKFNHHSLFDMLFAEYGGHPHLTRQACSVVAEARLSRPLSEVPYSVTASDLDSAFARAGEGSPADAAWQILRSFDRWYPEEADIVRRIAGGEHLTVDRSSITHAIGFGLCDEAGGLRMNALVRATAR